MRQILFFIFLVTLTGCYHSELFSGMNDYDKKTQEFVPIGTVKIPREDCSCFNQLASEWISKTKKCDSVYPDFIDTNKTIAVISSSLFWDKKYVSNKDYKQFVRYVQDSILRIRLGYVQWYSKDSCKVDMKSKINYDDTILHSEFTSRNSIGKDSLSYRYFFSEYSWKREIKQFQHIYGNKVVPIFPDTTVWLSDTLNSFSVEQKKYLSEQYFSNPKFNDLPCVGLNQQQIEAYLKWRTLTVNQKRRENGKNNLEEYRLPNYYEYAYFIDLMPYLKQTLKIKIDSEVALPFICPTKPFRAVQNSAHSRILCGCDEEFEY